MKPLSSRGLFVILTYKLIIFYMSSYLTKRDGIYDPSKRYGFKNITKEEGGIGEDFTFVWNGTPFKVKVGQEVELPEHLALHATKYLVDKIMIDSVRDEEIKMRAKLKEPFWRSARGLSVGIPEARKPLETKILRELKIDDENPQMAVIRAQIKEELLNDLNAEKSQPVARMSVKNEEFAEIKSKK